MKRLIAALSATVVAGTCIGYSALSVDSARLAEPTPVFPSGDDELVFFTEDIAVANPFGCDAISVADGSTGQLLHLGKKRPSPGRMTSLPDLSLIVATPNQIGTWEADNGLGDRLYALYRDVGSPDGWADTWLGMSEQPVPLGGLAITPNSEWLLVATQSGTEECMELSPSGQLPYAVSKYRIDQVDLGGRHLGPEMGRLELLAPVAAIIPDRGGSIAHIVMVPQSRRALGEAPAVLTIDVSTMREIAPRVPFAISGSLGTGCHEGWDPIGVTHATISSDRRFLVTNRWLDGDLNVVDLESRRSWTLDLDYPRGTFVGGVKFNLGPENRGLLAVHLLRRVAIFQWTDGKSLVKMAERTVPPPMEVRDGGKIYGSSGISTGPPASIAWSGSGAALIASINTEGVPEFRSWSVQDSGRRMEPAHDYTVCKHPENFANDILTGNGLLPTRTPSPSPSSSPSPTPSSTVTASPPPPSAAPTRTPAATATRTVIPPTRTPDALHLPLVVVESCVPTQRHVDVALVLDASSSMGDPTSVGRSKLAAAVDAARTFLDQLNLAGGDQAAVVTFNTDANLLAPLTKDRAALDSALSGITTAQFTRIDLGLAVARTELASPRHRAGNTPVLILLTDGRANPVPVSVAEAEARAAKDAGVVVFTIGLGVDLDEAALVAMASRPSYAFTAVDGEQLSAIYREIAVTIPCPTGAFWGRR